MVLTGDPDHCTLVSPNFSADVKSNKRPEPCSDRPAEDGSYERSFPSALVCADVSSDVCPNRNTNVSTNVDTDCTVARANGHSNFFADIHAQKRSFSGTIGRRRER